MQLVIFWEAIADDQVPTAHPMHALEEEARLTVDHVPKPQFTQDVAPTKDDHVPDGQVTHAAIDPAPLVGLYVATTQGIQ
jgi:hypothetical protein